MNTERLRNQSFLSKVPEVTVLFWLVKIMGTTVGETSADFLARDLNLGLVLTTGVMGLLLVAAFVIQFISKKYTPWKYWLTVILVSVVGTLITDNMTDNLQIPLLYSTIFFSILLTVAFVVWYLSEKTLSIHSIFTPKRELFYWAAILFTFALGTAGGDFLAEQINLGYALSGVVFASVIALVAVCFFLFRMDPIWSFWMAYVLTRPLGASCGDLLIRPVDETGLGVGSTGGLGLGLGPINLFFFLAILGCVVFMSIQSGKRKELRPES